MRMGLHIVITGQDFNWMMLPDETVEDWLLPDNPYHHQVSCSCCMLKHISFCALKWRRCYIKPLCTSLPVHIQLRETSWADTCVGLFFGLFKQHLYQHLNPFMICAVTGDISLSHLHVVWPARTDRPVPFCSTVLMAFTMWKWLVLLNARLIHAHSCTQETTDDWCIQASRWASGG